MLGPIETFKLGWDSRPTGHAMPVSWAELVRPPTSSLAGQTPLAARSPGRFDMRQHLPSPWREAQLLSQFASVRLCYPCRSECGRLSVMLRRPANMRQSEGTAPR
jgi:hypothetical protein